MPAAWSKRGDKRETKVRPQFLGTALALFVVFPLLTAFVVIKSLQLRPGGDDYCLAVAGQFGLFGGVAFWWETFSGFLTPTVLANTLVGLPLLHLPFGLSSAITFWVAAAAVSVSTLLLIGKLTQRSRLGMSTRVLLYMSVACSIAVAWWSYWWLPVALGDVGDDVFLAQSITHNQNPSAGHVLQTIVVIASAALAVQFFRSDRPVPAWIFTVLSAVSAGFSGPAMGGAYVVTLLIFLGFSWNYLPEIRVPRIGLVVAAVVGSASLLAALSSPGSRVRSAELQSESTLTLTSVGEILNATFPESIWEWVAAFSSPGALAVLLLGFIVGSGLGQLGIHTSVPQGIATVVSLALFSLLLAIASSAGQVFSYDAFWHFLDNRVAAFFSVIVASVVLGQQVASRVGIFGGIPQALLLITGVGLAVGAILTMTISIAERQQVWEQGPAPIEGVVTELLDDPRGLTCWGALTHLREVPARGVTRELPAWDPESGRLMSAR